VILKASLKTHLSEDGALLESDSFPHGGPSYHFKVNIDGQAVNWEAKGVRENFVRMNGRHFPEEGEDMRYVLEKRIRLDSGTHRIFVGVPEENYAKTVTVDLQEDRSYTLELQPIYPRYKWGHPTYRLGLLGFSSWLDNTSID
jgi:hypothetical protein